MSWGHHYYEEPASYDTPTYYDGPNYETAPYYTSTTFETPGHSRDDPSISYQQPFLTHNLDPTYYNHQEPSSYHRTLQDELNDSSNGTQDLYNSGIASHEYTAPNEHKEAAHLENATHNALERVSGHLDLLDRHLGPPSGQYEPQEIPDASHDVYHACDVANDFDASPGSPRRVFVGYEARDLPNDVHYPLGPSDELWDPSYTSNDVFHAHDVANDVDASPGSPRRVFVEHKARDLPNDAVYPPDPSDEL